MLVTHNLNQRYFPVTRIPRFWKQKEESFSDTQIQLNKIRDEYESLSEKYHTDIQVLQEKVNDIVKACPHESTEYHPDPSGNNDSWSECLVCGKTL